MASALTLEKIRRVAFLASISTIGVLTAGYLWVIFGGSIGSGQGSYTALDFTTLNHQPGHKAFLACDYDICPDAIAERGLYSVEMPISSVHAALADAIDNTPEIKRQRFDFMAGQYDLTYFLRDQNLYQVVVVKLIDAGPRTDIALYSYQPIGESKLGDHQARAAKFMDLIYRRLR